MRSKPDCNYPLFNEVETWLKTAKAKRIMGGLDVEPVNPARNFNGETTHSFRKYISLSLRQTQACKAIVLLPGWEHSEGARLEAQMGLDCGLDFWLWQSETYVAGCAAVPVSRALVGQILDATEPPHITLDTPIGPDVTIEEEAALLVRNGARQGTYGHPRGDFDTISRIWSAILSKANGFEVKVEAEQVALCMAGLKLSRLARDSQHHDSKVDVIGYMVCLDRLDEEGTS